jgi:hypothetical protein
MTTPISPSRQQILQEDVAYRRSVSEVILTKVGAQNNFINTFQTDSHRWNLNGSYSVATGIDFYDGPQVMFYNAEIVAISFWQENGGTGTTEFDLRWINSAGVDQGTIFSVTPKISSTTRKIGFRNLVTGTNVSPAGVTLPTFSKTTFLEGQSIYLRLLTSMTEARNGGVNIFYRPIN